MADPEVRQRLVEAAAQGRLRPGHRGRGPPARLRPGVPDGPAAAPHRPVAEVAAERGMDPVALMIDRAVASRFDQLFIQPISSSTTRSSCPSCATPGGDDVLGLRGPRQPGDRQFHPDPPTGPLGPPAPGLHAGPGGAHAHRGARRGLGHDRPGLRGSAGAVADLNVFDPATVGPAMPEVADDLPGGARRLRQGSTGFRATVVAGQPVLLDGRVHRGPAGAVAPRHGPPSGPGMRGRPGTRSPPPMPGPPVAPGDRSRGHGAPRPEARDQLGRRLESLPTSSAPPSPSTRRTGPQPGGREWSKVRRGRQAHHPGRRTTISRTAPFIGVAEAEQAVAGAVAEQAHPVGPGRPRRATARVTAAVEAAVRAS